MPNLSVSHVFSYLTPRNAPHQEESFFTVIGCMDGRCVDPIEAFGRKKYHARYPDYITEAGIVGILASKPSQEFLESLKNKILISIKKHHSRGIIVDGHAECAGDPVPDDQHKEHIRKAVKIINEMTKSSVPTIGVFIKRSHDGWSVEEVPQTMLA